MVEHIFCQVTSSKMDQGLNVELLANYLKGLIHSQKGYFYHLACLISPCK